MFTLDDGGQIDTSFVSLAEYELFLGQSALNGLTLKPDHWRNEDSRHLPGRSPILGIRANDGVLFCNWLTRRDSGYWRYRLPSKQDVRLIVDGKHLLGEISDQIGVWADRGQSFVWLSGAEPSMEPFRTIFIESLGDLRRLIPDETIARVCHSVSRIDLSRSWASTQQIDMAGLALRVISEASRLSGARWFADREAAKQSAEQAHQFLRDWEPLYRPVDDHVRLALSRKFQDWQLILEIIKPILISLEKFSNVKSDEWGKIHSTLLRYIALYATILTIYLRGTRQLRPREALIIARDRVHA